LALPAGAFLTAVATPVGGSEGGSEGWDIGVLKTFPAIKTRQVAMVLFY